MIQRFKFPSFQQVTVFSWNRIIGGSFNSSIRCFAVQPISRAGLNKNAEPVYDWRNDPRLRNQESPYLIPLNKYMRRFRREGRWEKMTEYYKRMKKQKTTRPNGITMSNMLIAFSLKGNLVEIEKYLADIERLKIKKDIGLLNSIIKALSRCKAYTRAAEVFSQLESNNMVWQFRTASGFLRHLDPKSVPEEATTLYADLKKEYVDQFSKENKNKELTPEQKQKVKQLLNYFLKK